jgi:hypothetical protein
VGKAWSGPAHDDGGSLAGKDSTSASSNASSSTVEVGDRPRSVAFGVGRERVMEW